MPAKKVKITVVRKLDLSKIHPHEDMGNEDSLECICPLFKIGQEFVVGVDGVPKGFCPGAFADIYRYVSGLRAGADYPWMKAPGTAVACCTDGLRPVVFRIERLAEDI